MKEALIIFTGAAVILVVMVIIIRRGRPGRFQAALEEALKAMHK